MREKKDVEGNSRMGRETRGKGGKSRGGEGRREERKRVRCTEGRHLQYETGREGSSGRVEWGRSVPGNKLRQTI